MTTVFDREKIVHKCSDERRNELSERMNRASHAIQSGVQTDISFNDRLSATSPKHLRTGINISMCEHAGLGYLLMTKGVITEEEYLVAICESLEQEKARYEERLSNKFQRPVTLG